MKKFVLILFIFPYILLSYNHNDSLILSLKNTKSNTAKLKIIKDICLIKNEENDADALKFIYDGLMLSKEENDKSNEAFFLNQKGIYLRTNGDYSKAVDNLYNALHIYERLNDKRNIAEIYRNLGETFRGTLDFENSLTFLNKALSLFTSLKDTLGIAKTTNRFAAVYFEKLCRDPNFMKDTYYYTALSLDLSKKINDIELITNNYNILGAYYQANKCFDKALNCYMQALSLIDTSRNIDAPIIFGNLASFYGTIGNYKKSIEYALRSNQVARKLNLKNSYFDHNYFILSINYYKLKDFKNAFFYLDTTLTYKNKLYYEANNKHIIEMQTIYETQKKEKELELSRLEKTYLTYFFITVSLLLLVVLIFLFLRYRIKNKANILLKTKNEEITLKKEQLQKSEIKLQELNATKDKFFSIMAHDIKNPLISVIQLIELIDSEFDTFSKEELLDYIRLSKKSINNLYELLNNLLTWSRSQQGTISYAPTNMDINIIIKGVFDSLEGNANNKSIELINTIPNNIILTCDYNMLSTVFRNLISNAIKFSFPNSKIIVSSKIVDSLIEITIQDFGTGIEKENIEKLFRIDVIYTTVGTSKEKGTGLGLILCKEFVEKHGGTIHVESKLNEGSKFIFTLKYDENIKDID